jgi:hypothetical protein
MPATGTSAWPEGGFSVCEAMPDALQRAPAGVLAGWHRLQVRAGELHPNTIRLHRVTERLCTARVELHRSRSDYNRTEKVYGGVLERHHCDWRLPRMKPANSPAQAAVLPSSPLRLHRSPPRARWSQVHIQAVSPDYIAQVSKYGFRQ